MDNKKCALRAVKENQHFHVVAWNDNDTASHVIASIKNIENIEKLVFSLEKQITYYKSFLPNSEQNVQGSDTTKAETTSKS